MIGYKTADLTTHLYCCLQSLRLSKTRVISLEVCQVLVRILFVWFSKKKTIVYNTSKQIVRCIYCFVGIISSYLISLLDLNQFISSTHPFTYTYYFIHHYHQCNIVKRAADLTGPSDSVEINLINTYIYTQPHHQNYSCESQVIL